MRLVKDTNVFVAALKSGAGASRELLRRLLKRLHTPLLADKLFYEYQELLHRPGLWADCELDPGQRAQALEDFAAVCEFVRLWRLWRPNLMDEGDNPIMELCIYGNAAALVTFNAQDFLNARFAPPGLVIVAPGEFLQRFDA